MAITLIIGIGVFMLLVVLLLLVVKLDDPVFKVLYYGLGIITIIICLILVAKATYDDKDYCQVLPVNETVTGNLTQIDYSRVCFTNTNTTSSSFYLLSTWFVRLLALFTVLMLGYYGLKKIGEFIPRFRD